jgi:FMN phosphatase YigB (HAD superfamily)
MAKSLQEYAAWLDSRDDLIWPQPPPFASAKAKPSVKPIAGIKAVTWNLYGTLVRITDGSLMLLHFKEMRMQVALEKTINEFNMWNSMTRRPGAPWEYMLQKYRGILEDMELAGNVQSGDFPQPDSTKIWRRLLGMLEQKEYDYDRKFYGDMDELAEKVAWFFQSCLQGVEASPHAVKALTSVAQAGLAQGLLADAQPHSLLQALRVFGAQDKLPPLNSLLDPACLVLSHQIGVRKPSASLFHACVQRFAARDIQPEEILYVSNQLQGDLAIAKQFGMRTVLYAGDKTTLKATGPEIRHPELRPKRLLTDLEQIRLLISG